jgi:hypothetical protein
LLLGTTCAVEAAMDTFLGWGPATLETRPAAYSYPKER